MADELCRCGHYRREHEVTDLGLESDGLRTVSVTCTGNTWAYPDDAESDRDAREVRCQCAGFDPENTEGTT